jgi:hypothetical protein
MGWSAFSVSGDEAAEAVASQLLGVANDPSTWKLENMGATVIRRRLVDGNHFYFSPHAVPVFAVLMERHLAMPCDPPRARELVPARTSRMMLGFKTRWESFVPPRAISKGIARGSAP